MKHAISLTAAAVALSLSSIASAAEFKPAVSYDTAGKHDRSFGQAVYENGVTAFQNDSGVSVFEYTPANETQREQGLDRLARRGYSPIITVGFNYSSALAKVAEKYPETDFVIIDSVVDLPNVKSLIYAEHEGSFLVGALAAMVSETNAVSFVGGMDIPLIRKFACGYEQGAKHVNADIGYYQNMIGSTPSAFADPVRGAELAKSQFSRGSDVVFAAAGGSGNGVYQAAKDEGKLAIGVDSNQNYMFPGTMLTSMVKLVGKSTYDVFAEYKEGNFEAGLDVRNLAAGGIDWALDEYNRDLVSAEHEEAVKAIAQQIIDGEIKVHDYMASNDCSF
ncbi:BMP family lipoprotein [Aliagarivorans marinus]|uniref:BMP family lipoprotein n=1 Tax=Aliagarivorans marinus TaxID=561965 RepID=UPI00040471DA|nr:BMP family ABC transporter substrate-binding protein [Aliagarivorans marinus]